MKRVDDQTAVIANKMQDRLNLFKLTAACTQATENRTVILMSGGAVLRALATASGREDFLFFFLNFIYLINQTKFLISDAFCYW